MNTETETFYAIELPARAKRAPHLALRLTLGAGPDLYYFHAPAVARKNQFTAQGTKARVVKVRVAYNWSSSQPHRVTRDRRH
jgi:hypothetical protein